MPFVFVGRGRVGGRRGFASRRSLLLMHVREVCSGKEPGDRDVSSPLCPALGGFGSLFTVCLPWVAGLPLRKSKASLSGTWAIRKEGPQRTYLQSTLLNVLLNGLAFHLWVC